MRSEEEEEDVAEALRKVLDPSVSSFCSKVKINERS